MNVCWLLVFFSSSTTICILSWFSNDYRQKNKIGWVKDLNFSILFKEGMKTDVIFSNNTSDKGNVMLGICI